MVMKVLKEFIKLESTSGLILFAMMIAALLISNSPWQRYYYEFVTTPISFSFHYIGYTLIKPLTHWVNEGLMTLFFLMVGLEIKQETVEGELSNLKAILLPGIAALGGMLFPALIYLIFNHHDKSAVTGWAIPTATDTAFALSLLALFGKKINVSLKVFLMSLAILDDIFAIFIITLFYNHHLSYLLASLALSFTIILIIVNRLGFKNLIIYCLMGTFLWLSLLESGIHAIIAGVILAMTIPISHTRRLADSPLKKMQTILHPWVAYLILPFFIFINAGISFHGLSINFLTDSIALGIILGLFIGKPVGIFIACWLAIKLKISQLAPKMTWLDLWNIGMLCGVGFTVSLFIGDLAFSHDNSLLSLVKLGVLTGSLLSGCLSCALLYYRYNRKITRI